VSRQRAAAAASAVEQTTRRRLWRRRSVSKSLHAAAPRYLADLCVPTASTDGRRQSRSAVSGVLLVTWTRTSTGQRSFAAYGRRTWNQLPTALRSTELSLASFKRQLKTHSSVPALDSTGCSCGCRVPSSHRRCRDCTASSAPTTNVQTRLDRHDGHSSVTSPAGPPLCIITPSLTVPLIRTTHWRYAHTISLIF